MLRVAVPIFQKRISPVIDCCERLLVIDIDRESEIERKDLFMDDMSLSDRLNMLKRLGVAVVICGGISETFYTMLQSCGIEPISGISGDADEVIHAFCRNQIKESQISMESPEK